MPNISKIKPTDGVTYDIAGGGGGGSSPSPASANPLMDGTVAVGTSSKYAREDHRHPTDTSRAPTNHASSSTTYGTGTGSNYGHVKLSDSTSSTSSTSGGTAATPKAVRDALSDAKDYADNAVASKQDALVSGTNIKTVNGQSLLGSGNIVISGGGATLPIGTVYESVFNTNPSASLGDTWEFLGTSEVGGIELVTDGGDLIIASNGDVLGFATTTYKFVRTA